MARRKRSNTRGIVSGLAGLTFIAAAAAAAVYTRPDPRDEESLCLMDQRGSGGAITETAHHLLIIDKTDKWNGAQEARLRHVITDMRVQLGLNERLTIFVFSGSVNQGFPPVFSLCNPGRASDTNIWTSNPRRWEKRFVESFGKPLDEILEGLIKAEEGPVSPILEVLVDITNREELIRREIPRRIVLVSDMLQNSDAYSFFSKRRARPGVGGPFVPMPLAPGLRPDRSSPRQPRYSGKNLNSNGAVDLVESKGGLRHISQFRLEVYQIRGVYAEDKLAEARRFWDLIARQYGARIEWKIL